MTITVKFACALTALCLPLFAESKNETALKALAAQQAQTIAALQSQLTEAHDAARLVANSVNRMKTAVDSTAGAVNSSAAERARQFKTIRDLVDSSQQMIAQCAADGQANKDTLTEIKKLETTDIRLQVIAAVLILTTLAFSIFAGISFSYRSARAR